MVCYVDLTKTKCIFFYFWHGNIQILLYMCVFVHRIVVYVGTVVREHLAVDRALVGT